MMEIKLLRKLGKTTLDVDLKLPTVGLTAVFGRSGSGKTTLINILSGLSDPDEGRIQINGELLYDSSARIKIPVYERSMGYVFQDSRLFPHMTVRGNLKYGYNPAGQIRLDEVIALLDIGHLLPRRPHHLSGGEKQRVAIGRALLTNPALLLMDEPLSALDENRKSEIFPFIERVRDVIQTPIFYVTHSKAEVAKLANTVVLLSDGKAIRVGSVDDVWDDLEKLVAVTKAVEGESA
jgi:molybdate transport system ATP-binding protein